METETLIVGGGLSGLYAAHLLHSRGKSFHLIEARPDFGGRIRTERRDGAVLEFGASWFWPDTNPRVARLVEQFGLASFPQHNDGDVLLDGGGYRRRQPHRQVDPRVSLRLTNGTRGLIEGLLETLPEESLSLGHRAHALTRRDEGGIDLAVSAEDGGRRVITAENVIIAMPLRLLAKTLSFHPEPPPQVLESFRNTPTWMAGEAKFLAVYDRPFWRDQGLSGTAISPSGALAECHDASSPGGSGALLGFIGLDPAERASLGDGLIDRCLEQLERNFGTPALSPKHAVVMDWANEKLTATVEDAPLMGHPLYGLQPDHLSLWDGSVRIAGTESSTTHGGYLEGALQAAERAVGNG